MQDLLRQYGLWIIVAVAALALLSGLAAYFLHLNRKLKASDQKLKLMTLQLEKSSAKLQRLSTVDGLTRISNRRLFDETLAREWARAVRSETSIAVIMVDIDHFKAHNDKYGHQAGDECLKQVAVMLDKILHRATDLVARYGGEEFAVILPDVNLKGASAVAERMRVAVENLKLSHCHSVTGHDVTISLGVAAIVPAKDSTSHELVAAADQALYRAKAVGRNQVIEA